jgi:RimJ/RimL family protein N-acetyltransferase
METSSTDDLGEAVARLERDPLRNIVLLKHIEAFREHVSVIQESARQGVGTLVLLDTRASAYDRETYPEAALAAMISSDSPSLTRTLMNSVPKQHNVVFKLANDADRDVVADHFPIDRATSFLSFTADAIAFAVDEEVAISSSVSDEVLRLFETQGHPRGWLRPLLSSDRAFACVLERDGDPLSACFAFANYRQVWEVGGVVTPERHRQRGLASRVVRRTLVELQRRGLVPRYQVNEDNLPSIRLATSAGLRLFLQLTHYRTW